MVGSKLIAEGTLNITKVVFYPLYFCFIIKFSSLFLEGDNND